MKSVRAAADEAGIPAFVNARTDLFFVAGQDCHDLGLLDEALERSRIYSDAGADGLFVPGLADALLIARLVDRCPLPINIMIAAGSLTNSELAGLGVARISYGPAPYLSAMHTLREQAEGALRLS